MKHLAPGKVTGEMTINVSTLYIPVLLFFLFNNNNNNNNILPATLKTLEGFQQGLLKKA